MIDLYYFPTPNTWKVSLMLEECGLKYNIVPIDILQGEQFAPEFLEVSPNNRVPAIVDRSAPDAPQSVFESGAILIYLAEKTGRFLATSGPARTAALEWLFWQMGGLGPMAGQAHHFVRYAPEGNDYGRERYLKECTRLYGVLDRRLECAEWLAGDEYSIADMASWGWIWFHRMHGQDIDQYPSVKRWFFAMSGRPAVARVPLIGQNFTNDEIRMLYQRPFWNIDPTFAKEKTEVN